MEYSLTPATWFWLLVPMPALVLLSLISLLLHGLRGMRS
ncbi:hypothetical protein SAMN05421721_104205 [Ectothiorhodospira mobilis]|uniref:Uncharacterized protein n=1 Tax=Ectothiorhodospira mobilis TaxID=195064 RepID=A0A1I4QJF0_ECTMO|nr:hypothetical protein SAMN05421721_104205 [Ectothiorhodospira mobilis]